MRSALDALAATKDPRAIPILLTKAQPGEMERVRLTALAGLARFAQTSEQDYAQETTSVVRAALEDPFAPVRQAGAGLAGQLHLTQLCLTLWRAMRPSATIAMPQRIF
jgi:hypothetical protein